jgi:hypothetical protein
MKPHTAPMSKATANAAAAGTETAECSMVVPTQPPTEAQTAE